MKEDNTCYIERSKVREILITSSANNETTRELLADVDALKIFVASDFAAVSQPEVQSRDADLAHPERLKALSDAAAYVEMVGARYHSGRDIANGIRCLGPQSPTAAQEAWMPIETAPKGDDSILATDARIMNFTQVVFWYPDHPDAPWATDDGIGYPEGRFTHWMPVPMAPALPSAHREGGK